MYSLFANTHLDPMNGMGLTGEKSHKHIPKLMFYASEVLYIHSTDLYRPQLMYQTNLELGNNVTDRKDLARAERFSNAQAPSLN